MKKKVSVITLTEGLEERRPYFIDLRNSLESQFRVDITWIVSAPDEDSYRSLVGDTSITTKFLEYEKGETLGKRRNNLLSLVDNDYVMNIDDDDFLLHDAALWNSVRELEENPHVSLTIGRILTKINSNTYQFWSDDTSFRYNGSYQLAPGIYYRNDLVEKISDEGSVPVYSGAALYRTECSLVWEEKLKTYEDLHVLLHAIDGSFLMSDDMRYVYRSHSDSTMSKFTDKENHKNLTEVLNKFL